jgi:glycosyltransferase involved in cell wall biosynthesis
MADSNLRVLLLAGRLRDGRELVALANRLRQRCFVVRVVAPEKGPSKEEVEILESPGLSRTWGRSWAIRQLLEFDPSPPDLIHALEPSMASAALDLAESWQIPYLLTVSDFLPRGSRLRLSQHWCRGIVADDRDVANDLESLGIPRAWVSTVPFGIDPPSRVSDPRAVGRVPVVGAAAPLVSGSGVATFLQAALRVVSTISDVEFVVAGNGRGEPDLRRLADRLGIADRVTFAEDPRRGRTLWSVLDIFCQPALSAWPCRTLATALAWGVPAIASDVPGPRSWLEDAHSGRLVSPGDADALSATILDLLQHPDQAMALGHRGRQLVIQRADPEREADELCQVYRRALGQSTGPIQAQVA